MPIFCLVLIISMLASPHELFGQPKPNVKVSALNNYTRFVNESVHGLLIIHRLLELYNQEINKVVDLPNYQLNLFSNADFPENIFRDKSGSFYPIPPHDLYTFAIKGSANLPKGLAQKCNNLISDMLSICDELERSRYAIGTLIANTDLKHRANLNAVYSSLDACVLNFDQFELKRQELNKLIIGEINAKSLPQYKDLYLSLLSYSKAENEAFDMLRKENIPNARNSLLVFQKSNRLLSEGLNAGLKKMNDSRKIHLLEEINKVNDKQNLMLIDFVSNPVEPKEYEMYGPSYYFYNVQLASTINKYGSGVIERSNVLLPLLDSNMILMSERTHYYKVIRPKEILEVKDSVIEVSEPPKLIEDRKVVMDGSKNVSTNDEKLLVEIFDHQEFDHDTISLSLNGKWVLKNQLITKDPIRLYLSLEKGKDNYLILYAENLGSSPPNTCAIRYLNNKGKYNQVVLNADLEKSEMIIIHRE